MKNFWRRYTKLRRLCYGVLVLLFLLFGGVLYLAYAYMPAENRADTPGYLRWMQAQHLDGYMDAGNFRLHYLHMGSGAPVVLLPGGGGWIYDFREIISALAPHYSVYAIDPPGDGYTTPLVKNPDYSRIYTLDLINQSLLAFVDKLHIARASFIGNSWGGGYALYFTETHPERVNRYVSLDGTGLNLSDNWEWELAKRPVLGEVEMKLTTTPDYIRQTLEQLYAPRKVTADMVQEYSIPYLFHGNLISQWVLERNLDWSVTERLLPRLTAPTLVLWGQQDEVLDPHLFLPRWRHLDPRATIIEIDQASHAIHDSQPERVNQLLLDFLAS